MVGDLAAEGRHAIGTAFEDGGANVLRWAAVDPIGVHQRRTDAATAVKVATGTVILVKKFLALGGGVRALFIFVADRLRRRNVSGMKITLGDMLGGFFEIR